ncbi:MAG: hypothetical protein ACJASQ_001420 [Crocinitomicaceae bacterium]|jgi:hypothetical protein
MSRFRILIAFLLLSTFSQFTTGQTFDQLGASFSGPMLTSDPVEVFYDSQNAPLVAKMQNGNLRVDKFDGSAWSALDPLVPVVASNVLDFEVDFDITSNKIIVIYAIGDSLYLRKHFNGWQEQFLIGAYSSSNTDQFDLTINPHDNLAYIAYNTGSGTAWVEFDYNSDTFTPMATITMVTYGTYFDESDINYNEKDSLMYFAYENYGLDVGVATYDGINWNNLMTSAMGMGFGNTTANITAEFDTTGANNLMIHTATVPDNEVGIVQYSMPGQVSSTLEPWYAPPSIAAVHGCDMTIRHTNTRPAYAYSSYPTNTDMKITIKHWDGASWNVVNNSFVDHKIMDIAYDLNDDLLLATISENDNKLYIYRVNIHTVGISEISAQEVHISPNPATETITVSSSAPCQAHVVSIDGNIVISSQEIAMSHHIDVQQLNSGLYFVRTIMKDGTIRSSRFNKL